MSGTTKPPYEMEADAKIVVPSIFYFTNTVHHDTYDKISPLRPELSAEAKNVVVTGGGTGIGRSIAISFAQAGAKSVCIVGRREQQLQEALVELKEAATDKESFLMYKVADLMKRDETNAAFRSIADRVGKLDILVSNAAAFPGVRELTSYDDKDFMRSFDLNVLTAFNAVQAFFPLSSPKPMILNISSWVAHFAPMAVASGYGISKAANLKMMDYFAAENPRVHVVNVQPGTVATEMSAQVGVKAPDAASLPGHFCVWLASPEASLLKSKFVWANWDVDELMARSEEIKGSRLFTWVLDGVPM